jgi:DHA2 family multidrug resistance protein
MTQFHRYGLIKHVATGDTFAEDRLGMFSGAFYAQGMDAEHSRVAAHKVLDGQITQQTYAMAANNVFILTGILFALAIPFILLIKRTKGGGGGASVH